MTDQPMPALRRRFLDDMRIKGLLPKTPTMYLRAMREFTRFLGHSPDTATPEELRAFLLDMKERGVGAPTFNNRLTVLSFFYAMTCARPEMKRHMQYQRAAKKIPVVLSAAEVTRILEAAPGPGLRYRAAFSVPRVQPLIEPGEGLDRLGQRPGERSLGVEPGFWDRPP